VGEKVVSSVITGLFVRLTTCLLIVGEKVASSVITGCFVFLTTRLLIVGEKVPSSLLATGCFFLLTTLFLMVGDNVIVSVIVGANVLSSDITDWVGSTEGVVSTFVSSDAILGLAFDLGIVQPILDLIQSDPLFIVLSIICFVIPFAFPEILSTILHLELKVKELEGFFKALDLLLLEAVGLLLLEAVGLLLLEAVGLLLLEADGRFLPGDLFKLVGLVFIAFDFPFDNFPPLIDAFTFVLRVLTSLDAILVLPFSAAHLAANLAASLSPIAAAPPGNPAAGRIVDAIVATFATDLTIFFNFLNFNSLWVIVVDAL
jgi:hypothetical protein